MRPAFLAFLFQKISSVLKKMTLFAGLLLFSSCQSTVPDSFQSILALQPSVVSISPNPEEIQNPVHQIEIIFSAPLEGASISQSSIWILEGNRSVSLQTWKDFEEEIEEGNLKTVNGAFEYFPESKKVVWAPFQQDLGQTFTVVVTPRVQGLSHVPFNQIPGDSPTPFVRLFSFESLSSDSGVGGVTSGSGSDTDSSSSGGSSGGSSSGGSSGNSGGGSSTPADPGNGNGGGSIPGKIRPDFFRINELLYDAAGSDTDGNEFIELYGTPKAEISGYQIVFINGADGASVKTLTLPEPSFIRDDGLFLIADGTTADSSVSHILGADWISEFDPQNGPDAVQVLDDQGLLLDAMAYGAGNPAVAQNGLSCIEGNPAEDVGSGHSLSRVNGADTQDNALDFINLSSPTPGLF